MSSASRCISFLLKAILGSASALSFLEPRLPSNRNPLPAVRPIDDIDWGDMRATPPVAPMVLLTTNLLVIAYLRIAPGALVASISITLPLTS